MIQKKLTYVAYCPANVSSFINNKKNRLQELKNHFLKRKQPEKNN